MSHQTLIHCHCIDGDAKATEAELKTQLKDAKEEVETLKQELRRIQSKKTRFWATGYTVNR